MKRLILLGALLLMSTPKIALAQNDNSMGDEPRHHINATEMAALGAGVAILVGAAGYLILRRKHSA